MANQQSSALSHMTLKIWKTQSSWHITNFMNIHKMHNYQKAIQTFQNHQPNSATINLPTLFPLQSTIKIIRLVMLPSLRWRIVLSMQLKL